MGVKADESLQCRNGDLMPELCSDWGITQFYNSSELGSFIASIKNGGFVLRDLPEFLIANSAEHHVVELPPNPRNREDYAFARALVWKDRNATELARPSNRDWWTVSAMQNNLATALTVELLRRELYGYAERWHSHGYCS